MSHVVVKFSETLIFLDMLSDFFHRVILSSTTDFPKDQQFGAVQAAIFLLPDENREALQCLLFFLHEVVACVEENQMTPTNIAVCLAPSLFHLNVLKRDSTSSRSLTFSFICIYIYLKILDICLAI